jgi:hypothetical protein
METISSYSIGRRTVVIIADETNLRLIGYYFRRGMHGVDLRCFETPLLKGMNRGKLRKWGGFYEQQKQRNFYGYDFVKFLNMATVV